MQVNHVNIMGIGPVLACGEGMDALKTALLEGRAGEEYNVSLDRLGEFVAPKRSRRMDRLTRMAVLSVYLALKDAGVEPDEAFKHETGIVFGTALGPQGSTFSFLDSIIDDGDHCASSFSFTSSVHNTAASQVSFTLGIRGPIRTVTTFGFTAGAAVETAMNWLRNNKVKRVLLILGEESSGVLSYCARKMGGGGGVRPFSKECTYTGGEGCVTFLLENGANGKNGYCTVGFHNMCLSEEEAGERSGSCDMLFCASTGKADEFELYERIRSRAPRVGAYSAIYGSLPTGMGVELAIAALSMRDNSVFPVPGAGERAVKQSLKKTAAAAVSGPGSFTFVELECR